MSKKRLAALGAGASAAMAGSVLFAPAAVADGQDRGPFPSPSAFAVQATGLVDIKRTPYVVGDGDESFATVELPQDDPALTVEALNAEAQPGKAHSSILHLRLGGDRFSETITAKVIEANCADGKGSINLVNLKVGGEEISIGEQIEPNTGADFDNPLLNITLNKQVRHDDGSLTVTAISVELLDQELAEELGVNQTINLASATCSDVPDDGDKPDDGGDKPDDGDKPDNGHDDGDKDNGGDGNGHKDDGGADDAEEDGTAPTPVPQPDHIAVTG